MAEFDRSKPHVNVGTMGHVDHGKQLLLRLLQQFLQKNFLQKLTNQLRMIRLTTHQKKKLVVLPSLLLTKNTKQKADITLTWTCQDTPTMLKT